MASKYYTFNGKAKWVRREEDQWGNYTADLYPDEKSLEAFKNSGMQLTPKVDEDGTFIRFRRPAQKLIKKELVTFGPPKIVDNEGKDFNGIIGNGSEVTFTVVAYETSNKGIGHRLEKIQVNDLVPYERPASTIEERLA